MSSYGQTNQDRHHRIYSGDLMAGHTVWVACRHVRQR